MSDFLARLVGRAADGAAPIPSLRPRLAARFEPVTERPPSESIVEVLPATPAPSRVTGSDSPAPSPPRAVAAAPIEAPETPPKRSVQRSVRASPFEPEPPLVPRSAASRPDSPLVPDESRPARKPDESRPARKEETERGTPRFTPDVDVTRAPSAPPSAPPTPAWPPGRMRAVADMPALMPRPAPPSASLPPNVASPVPGEARATRAEPERAAPAGPIVRIAIGRIEVRASSPPAVPPKAPAPRPERRPALSLDEYLERRR